jgi:hypothetical protein
LVLPADWSAWNPESAVSYEPVIMAWPDISLRLLIVIGTTPTAAYGIRAPFIYRLEHHAWKLASKVN